MDPTAKTDETQGTAPASSASGLAGDTPGMTTPPPPPPMNTPTDMSTVPPPPLSTGEAPAPDSSPFGGSAPVSGDTSPTTETSEPEPFTVSGGGGGRKLNKKVVGGILGVLVLVAAVGAGLALVQQQQLFQQGAYTGTDSSCGGTYPSCQTEGGQNTGYICQCVEVDPSTCSGQSPCYATNCGAFNPSSCPTTPVDNCPNGQYYSSGCGQNGCPSGERHAYQCDSATGNITDAGCQIDVSCSSQTTAPTPVPSGLLGSGQTCGTMETNGTWTIQSCGSGLACSWYNYNDTNCVGTGYPVRCYSRNACVLSLADCPRPGTNPNYPPRCVAVADREPPAAGTNACAGSCCSADTTNGFSVQKWQCSTFLQDGRCTAATGGQLVSTSGQECVDSSFCGSQQVDVVNSDGIQQSNLAIAQNGQSVCGEATPTPSGDATPTPSGAIDTTIAAQCLNIKAFDNNWVLLTAADLTELREGDIVRFTANGTTTSGTLDRARFSINGIVRTAVTQKRPNTQEFYDEYTIPAGTTTFTISAELHHTDATIGWF